MSDSDKPETPEEGSTRHHVYDGIEEFNKRLPNWWLFTLYGAIVFSIGYWFYYAQSGVPVEDGPRVEAEIARIQAIKMSSNVVIDDPHLWEMSRNAVFIAGGEETYQSLCAACHLPSLRGKSESPAAIGPDLTDGEWIHGAEPINVYHVVDAGVLEKGMPAWGPVLGTEKTAQVVAFILSHHQAP
ncbi:cbb3-type cytochrome c oxidase N-terminal domain-containing protein [Synoicihabitans lomoniglobus]|uniref:Cbb3-type cytochrome c oxidase N-terminal domain-containing protein n=1 Tax=Synoicihabitans lomoniglobus TaxID=2909285 RepID=A0AAE9ZYI5_9BACT|nr:c-type cytochrome [Opitutaceae bacterium LMO-M01]WED63553.1 cbb3-type cytochrome c oxidase N-terminal domain-containing protein [Opitutaceae bacterium LMO-M01]